MLPIEMLEAVIDQAGDDVAFLHDLSLICHALLPRARYHLFASILIKTVPKMKSSIEFLDSCPWVLPLVRNVSLSISLSKSDTISNICALDVVPVYFLSRLPNLRTWKMGLNGFEGIWKRELADLLLHRSALSCYQRYGSCIRSLELASTPFQLFSHFTGLVSSFTRLESLTCSRIWFRTRHGYEVSPPGSSKTTARAKPLRIKHLHVGISSDFRAAEYLLESSQATLNNLTFTLDESRYSNFLDRLESLLIGFSQLSSLTLIIPYRGIFWEDHSTGDMLKEVRHATRILQAIDPVRVKDVRVEFMPDPIAGLGSRLAYGLGSLEACKALEEALLTFPLYRILCYSPIVMRKAGRVEFWWPVVKRAFPRLDDRGLLTLIHLHPANRDNHADNDSQQPLGHETSVKCLIASNDSKRIVTASHDGTIIVWDAETNTTTHEWFAFQGPISALALSPDGRRLVAGGGVGVRGTLTVWDVSNGIHEAALHEDHTQAITACVWSPDGTLIAATSMDGTVRMWDGQTFEPRGPLRVDHPAAVSNRRGLDFSSDSRRLAWLSRSPEGQYGCTVLDLSAGWEEQSRWLSLPSPRRGGDVAVTAFSLAPDGGRVATAHLHATTDGKREDYAIQIWDVATGAVLAVLEGHTNLVVAVPFSPSGESVLSASYDGTAKLWDARCGEEKASLAADRSGTMDACFSPDGVYVATGSMGGAVRLWRVADGSQLAVLSERGAGVLHVAFSPDGEFLISGDCGGVVHVYRSSDFLGR